MSDVSFDSLEALAAAAAVFELNGGYFKVLDDYTELRTKYPNKQLLRVYFNLDSYSTDAHSYPLVIVKDEHIKIAKEIQHYSKKSIFKVLNKKPKSESFSNFSVDTDYEERLYQIINQDKIQAHDLGYVASAPLYFENSKKKDYANHSLDKLDSKWVGTVGERIVLNSFEVIRCTKSKNFDGYVVQGIYQGNLFLYFSSKDCNHINVKDKISIEGKIKDHIMEKNTIPMTKLNYVRERISNEITSAI